ncbi:MAG: FMN-binding protein [Spirochaetaceae bacterium]|jgi:electron transport complex protein RnfG|nr:FMN-binding protein [Spirochaetaceae bacterium]
MKEAPKFGITLALYSSVACTLLALVNLVTAPLIAEAKNAETQAGLKIVFPGDQYVFEEVTGFANDPASSVKVERLFLAKAGGATDGVVVQATGPTYDRATILIGVDKNRKISAIQFTALSDTPGFGKRAEEPAFRDQFKGKSIDDPFVSKSDVTAISGASITSNGVSRILKYATGIAGEYLNK